MKRFFTALILVLITASQLLALSDAEYLKMKKNHSGFARADQRLTQVWKKLKNSMSEEDFELLLQNQRNWISEGRDNAAKIYIKEGYTKAEAYMLATNDRAKELPEIADRIRNSEPEYADDDVGDEFENMSESRAPEGNYVKRNNNGKKIFMGVFITALRSKEAEVSFTIENSTARWTSNGWIEDDVLELYDKNFSSCSVVITFVGDSAEVEMSDSEDWNDILGTGINLSGKYSKNI